MWCWCSNVFLSPHTTPCFKPIAVHSVSATSLPQRRHRQEPTTDHQVGELGHTLTVNLNLESDSKQRNQPINGSDILWALQRVNSRKKIIKNNKKKEQRERGRDSSSAVIPMEESSEDYTNVRPLCINDNWGPKLDELENRLRNLSESI